MIRDESINKIANNKVDELYNFWLGVGQSGGTLMHKCSPNG